MNEQLPSAEKDATVEQLREALDDMWGCIAHAEIQHLQPETVEIAKANHTLLWHSETRDTSPGGGRA